MDIDNKSLYRPVSVIAVLAFLCALVIGGCGGGGEDPLTKAEFTQQADAICAQANEAKGKALEKEFARQMKTGKPFDKAAEEELVTNVALPPVVLMVEELEDLAPPEGDEEEIEKMIDSYAGGVAKMEKDPSAAMVKTVKEYPFFEADNIAKSYGLKDCKEI